MIYIAALGTLTTWFDERKALAFGIMSTGSAVGGIVWPAMLDELVSSVGFGWAVRTVGLVIFLLSCIALITCERRIKLNKSPVSMKDYTDAFKEMPFVMVTIAAAAGYFASYLPMAYIVLHAHSVGIEEKRCGYLVVIMHASG